MPRLSGHDLTFDQMQWAKRFGGLYDYIICKLIKATIQIVNDLAVTKMLQQTSITSLGEEKKKIMSTGKKVNQS